MRLFIEPADALMFRTGLPFDAGEGNLAISTFPPTPETLQGAIRALIAALTHPRDSLAKAFADKKLTTLIGDRSGYGRFHITQIGLGKYDPATPEDVELLLPAPAHILQDESGKLHVLVPKSVEGMMKATNLPDGIKYLLTPQESASTKLKAVQGWFPEKSLRAVLQVGTDATELKFVKNSDIYASESRLGIGLESGTRRTRDGYLYQQVVIRMHKGFGFIVDIGLNDEKNAHIMLSDSEVQAALFPQESGWTTLGGEQHAVHFRILKQYTTNTEPQSTKGKLVYLATPAYFSTAWKPSAAFPGFNQPVAAAVTRSEAIGGWKLNAGDAKGEQKALQLCVPAGSVFFYDEEVASKQPLTEYGGQIGYGITYIGDWKK